jgi:hypothetical protein
MINLTTNVILVNITRWKATAFDVETGRVTLQFLAPPATLPFPPSITKTCLLSNVANQSTGVIVNPSPQSWDDKIISVGPGLGALVSSGVGAANSLSNAQAAYANAHAASGGGAIAKHNAGLRAVEGVALTDGWVHAALTGT